MHWLNNNTKIDDVKLWLDRNIFTMRPLIQWKVISFAQNYMVSNDGRVFSIQRKDTLGRPVRPKVLKPKLVRGYPWIDLMINGKKRPTSNHRLVALCFIDNPKNYPEVNHKDGNKTNSNVDNLEWCTSSQNQIHSYETGLQTFSQETRNKISLANRNFNAKEVSHIKKIYKNEDVSFREIGRRMGCTHSVISNIINGRGAYEIH